MISILKKTRESVENMMALKKFKLKETAFTRKRKIGFKGILVFILLNLKHSLTIEIDKFLENLGVENKFGYTKQAFSKARQLIDPAAFADLNKITLEHIYNNKFKTFKGYRVVAVDGSTVQLPNTQEMTEKYGVFSKEKCSYPAGRICLTYDVLNEAVINGRLAPYDVSEQTIAMELIPEMYKSSAQDLLLFDRGFPSVQMIVLLNKLKKKYLFRVSRSFLKEINEFSKGSETDANLNIEITKQRIARNKIKGIQEAVSLGLRCVRIDLESEEEILITNLSVEEMSISELAELYNMRWGIETNYNLMKNVLELENFTGKSDIAVQQDFYATIYIVNIASILIADAQENYETSKKGKGKKYDYKINKRLAMGYLKSDLLNIVLEEDDKKADKLYERFIEKLSKHVVPIRPGRKFKRAIWHRPKFGLTNKKVM